MPPLAAVGALSVSDRYLTGTALRLRHMSANDAHDPGAADVYKLTQKIAQPCPGYPELAHGVDLVTNVYLSPDAHERLAVLPALPLDKVRLSIPPFSVDVFGPPLDGLVLAEIEFEELESARRWHPPANWAPFLPAGAEVTADRRFTGAALAASTLAAPG